MIRRPIINSQNISNETNEKIENPYMQFVLCSFRIFLLFLSRFTSIWFDVDMKSYTVQKKEKEEEKKTIFVRGLLSNAA